MQHADRYHEALSMQRHYDSMSQVAVTARAAVAGGTPILYKSLGLPVGGLAFFAAIPLLYIAMKIYEGCDVHAAYALKVAGLYEEHDDPMVKPTRNGKVFHGPAHAFGPRSDYNLNTTACGEFHSLIKKFFWGVTLVFVSLGCASLYVDLCPLAKIETSQGGKVQAKPTTSQPPK